MSAVSDSRRAPVRPTSEPAAFDAAAYRPASRFRRLLSQAGRRLPRERASLEGSAPRSAMAARPPGLLRVLGAALVVGVASGFLELAVRVAQVRLLHRVTWSSLMISRHAAWMLPVTAPLVILPLAGALVGPFLAWASWRSRGAEGSRVVRLAWGWIGMVLGMLFLLGPLLAIQDLYPVAPVALALGLGFRLRRRFARPTPAWPHISCWGAVLVILLLPPYVLWRWHSAVTAPQPAGAPPSFAGGPAPNLLWIVVDTLRADRMSLYGYHRPTTPELETWAKQGMTFEMARSAAPWTLPSHVTMFTGLWPFEHGAQVDRPYSGPSPTLAEHLRAQGYRTAGIVANVQMCNTAYGVGRGFDHYVDYPCNREISLRAMMYNSALGGVVMELGRRMLLPLPGPFPFGFHRDARAITAEARSWLEDLRRREAGGAAGPRRPFFLFLNLMDVHGPYLPPADAPRRFGTGPIPPKALASPGCGWRALQARNMAPPEQRPQCERDLEAVRRRLGDLYDDCLGGLDAELGRFLRDLRAAGLLANTWVVITADHGEHFGEHDRFGHGSSLYNELTHVPLLLIPPLGAEVPGDDPAAALRGRRIRVPVSLRDLPRTMTDLLVPGADNPFPGHSLARHWATSEPEPADPILAQLEEPRLAGADFSTARGVREDSVIVDDYILIESNKRPPELYHLFEDPKQQRNLADQPASRPRLEMMRRTLSTLRGIPDDR